MDLAQYLIPAAAGLISGAVASLIAPWVQWGIEERREQSRGRRELLFNARILLLDPPPVAEFRKLPIYFQLKPILSVATVKTVSGSFFEHGEVIQIVTGGGYDGVNPYAHLVLEDLSVQENLWKLI
jgi:hypothetical protein